MKYGVTVPIAGYIYKEVEAESEQEAVGKVFEDGYNDEDIQEVEMLEVIVSGNVFHGNVNKAYAEELGETEDDEE